MNNIFNSDMLKIARESNRWTQKELENESGVSQVIISKIEAGLMPASDELLEKFSKALDFPVQFFYKNFNLLDMGSRLHRKRASLKRKDENYIDALASIYEMCIRNFLQHVEIEINLPNMPICDYMDTLIPTKDESLEAAKSIANKARVLWNVPKGSIRDLTAILEKNGVFIFELDVPINAFDAVSFYSRCNNTGVVIINANLSPDRYRFTLAHELGHLIMHREHPSPNAENEANSFASELLMPSREMIHELKDLDFWHLSDLKSRWKVSMASLLVKANDVNAISKNKYQSLYVRLSQKGFRKNEPTCGLEKEKPSLIRDIIVYFTKELNYSKNDLAKLLSLSPNKFDEHFKFIGYSFKPKLVPIR